MKSRPGKGWTEKKTTEERIIDTKIGIKTVKKLSQINWALLGNSEILWDRSPIYLLRK
jgi:hypothetical protein